MAARFGEPLSAHGVSRCAVGRTGIDSRLHPSTQEARALAGATKRAAQHERRRSAARMTPGPQSRARRVALRREPVPTVRTDGHLQARSISPADTKSDRKPVQVMKFGGTSVADSA